MKKMIFVLLFAACTRAPSVADAGSVDDINKSCRELEVEMCKKVVLCTPIPEAECKKNFDPAQECLQSDKAEVDTCLTDLKVATCESGLPVTCLSL